MREKQQAKQAVHCYSCQRKGHRRGSEEAKLFAMFIKEIWQSSHIVKDENGTSKKEWESLKKVKSPDNVLRQAFVQYLKERDLKGKVLIPSIVAMNSKPIIVMLLALTFD